MKLLENYTFDPCEAFFFTIFAIFVSLLLGAAGIVMFTDTEHGNPYVIYPIATLFAVAIMMNLGDQNPSAKEVFWGWIFVTFGVAAASGIGVGLIYTLKLYLG